MNMINEWKRRGFSIVFTNGCFDILHYGHLRLLYEARQLGDRVIVGLNSDVSIRAIKGKNRPIIPQKERKAALEILSFVDMVLLYNEATPIKLVQNIKPDILLKGGDYLEKDIIGREYAVTTVTIPFEDGYSTTNIINSIRSKYNG